MKIRHSIAAAVFATVASFGAAAHAEDTVIHHHVVGADAGCRYAVVGQDHPGF